MHIKIMAAQTQGIIWNKIVRELFIKITVYPTDVIKEMILSELDLSLKLE